MKKLISIFFLISAIALVTFHQNAIAIKKTPEKTSLELQSIQSRDFETDKKTACASTLSVFQDTGYIIESASLESGFITAKSPTKERLSFWVGYLNSSSKVSAFIDEFIPGKTKVRLNFVNSEQKRYYNSQKDTPVENPTVYQAAFEKIQEAIFIRNASKP